MLTAGREELRGLFDPIVNEVIKLVSAQVAASSEGGRYKVNVRSSSVS